MLERIGVTHLDLHVPTKRDALLFDKIGIGALDSFIETQPSALAAELDWLREREVVFGTYYSTERLATKGTEEVAAVVDIMASWILDAVTATTAFADPKTVDETIAYFIRRFDYNYGIDATHFHELLATTVHAAVDGATLAEIRKRTRIVSLRSIQRGTRCISAQLRRDRGVDAVPIVGRLPTGLSGVPVDNYSAVCELVLSNLPLPDDSTPWEKILDFRHDTEARQSLIDLRRWMSNVSLNLSDTIALNDELEYLINRYQRHMELHRMKVNVEHDRNGRYSRGRNRRKRRQIQTGQAGAGRV